jgi:hypothetical protein
MLLLLFSSNGTADAARPDSLVSLVSRATLNLSHRVGTQQTITSHHWGTRAHHACASASADALDGTKSPPNIRRDVLVLL